MRFILGAILAFVIQLPTWAAPGQAVTYQALSPNDFKIIGGQVFVRLNSAIVLTNQTILITTNVNLTNAYFTINGTNVATVNPTDSYLPKRQSATNFIDSLAHDDGSWFSIDGTGQSVLELNSEDAIVFFGASQSKILFADPNTITYSNAVPTFRVLGPSGQITLSENTGVGALSTTQPDLALQAGGSRSVHFNSTSRSFSPDVTGESGFIDGLEFGDVNHFWTNGWFEGVLHLNGTADTVNFSRLDIYHGGPSDAIHFDSQSSGTAGDPVQMQFDFGGTNRFVMHKDGMFNAGRIVITNSATSQIGVNIDRRGLLQLLGADTSTARYQVFDVFLNGTEVMPNQFFADMRTNSFYEFSAVATNRVGSFRFGTTEPGDGFDPVFQVSSNSVVVVKGITKAQKALITPVEGMIVRQTDNTPGLRVYQGGAWVMISTVADP